MTKDQARLRDMLVWSRKAVAYLGDSSLADFLENELLQDACVRCIEVVGEAANHVSLEVRMTISNIEWLQVRGMCNILVHQYGAVDLEIVYEAITTFLPALISQLETSNLEADI